MDVPLDILILEDLPADAELLAAELRRAGLVFNWTCVDSRADYLASLENHFDMILADYALPQFTAIDAIRLLQQRKLDIPMIVVTGHVGEEIVVECLKQGAADYLLKDRLGRLGQAVQRALEPKRLRAAKERAEASLHESQERFQRLVDSSEDFIYSLDQNSRFTSVNDSFSRALGISEAAIVGKTHEELGLSIQNEREWRELIEQVLSTRENLRIEINTPMPDGFEHIFDVILTPLLDRSGEAIGVAGISRDITVKALLLEEANRRAAEMEAIAMVSLAMRNAHTRAELIPVVFDQFFNLLQVNCAAIGSYHHDTGEIWIEQGRGFCSDWKGRRVSAERGMFNRAIASGRPDFSQNIQSDIDELGLPVAGATHELNNPLTTVLLYAQLIQQQDIPPDLAHSAEKIASESLRAASIVRGLLDFARQRPAERKPSQINNILQKCIDLVAYELRSNSIQWETDLSRDLPITMVDPHQLQQVFINVLNNAWQAMSAARKPGRLRITTGVGPSTFFGGQVVEPNMIRITIQDDGPGIPRELLLRIFDPFFTTKSEGQGTGLGLSICHGIIAEHGGHIWVESEVGQGATFFIELPIFSPDTTPPSEEKQLTGETPSAVACILIVDDDTSVLEVLTLALKRKGFSVDTASDGTKALARLYRKPYDLIVCDIRMPELNGPDFYQQIQEKDPDLAQRINFTTGDMLNPTTRRFIEETGNPLLAKPFELEELIARINAILRRRAASTEAG